MRELQKTNTSQAMKLQISLFKTLLAQTLLVLATITLPIAILDVMVFTRNPYGSYYAQIALFPASIHALVDALTILYFIKPYKAFVRKKICGKRAPVPSIKIQISFVN